MEDAVGAEAAVGQRLRAIAESIGQRVAAFVGDAENLLILNQVELDQPGFVNDRIALHIAADADVAGLRVTAHLAQFGDRLVIRLRTLDAGGGEPKQRTDDDRHQNGEFPVFVASL